MPSRVLFVPLLRRERDGQGPSVLFRCFRLCRVLGNEARVLVPDPPPAGDWSASEIVHRFPDQLDPSRIVTRLGRDDGWELLVFDRFATTDADFDRCGGAHYPSLGLDEGGPARRRFSFLVDCFPTLYPMGTLDGGANLASEDFVSPPTSEATGEAATEAPVESGTARVLISFGAWEPTGLTERVWASLTRRGRLKGLLGPEEIDVLIGPAFERRPCTPGSRQFGPVRNLSQVVGRYDLVVTSFGFSPYEARRCGVPVVLVSPSAYHSGLARRAGFVHADRRLLPTSIRLPRKLLRAIRPGIHHGRLRSIVRGCLDRNPLLGPGTQKILGEGRLDDLIRELRPDAGGCPSCERRGGSAVARFAEKTYARCPDCRLVYLEYFGRDKVVYDADYFASEYQAQYGRTYLEDFDRIREAGLRRMRVIEGLRSGGRSLLDIGCAYGPFLSAAASRGFEVRGADIAEPAVRYVSKVLGLPAVRVDFPDFDPVACFGEPVFDVVSLWYVMEHFARLDPLMRRLRAIVRPGGILALSTPNGAGAMARFRTEDFFRLSPRDHYSVFDSVSIRRLFARHGFLVVKVVPTGLHPERIAMGRALSRIAPRWVRDGALGVLNLGDTFEVYARRLPESEEEA